MVLPARPSCNTSLASLQGISYAGPSDAYHAQYRPVSRTDACQLQGVLGLPTAANPACAKAARERGGLQRIQRWQRQLPAAGTFKALQGINLSIEVPGVVTQLHFESGQRVDAGQPLLQLEHQTEQAELDMARADQRLARQNFERGKELVTINAISRGEYDRLNAELTRHNALVAQRSEALKKKSIVAPFSGIIGIRQVDLGDFLQSGTVIASLQDTSSLYVDFHVPEQAAQLITIGQSVQVEVSARPGVFSLASVSAINPIVDDSTRNVLVRATLADPPKNVLPGMFADLRIQLADPQLHTVVAESAITFSPYGQYVYVVAPPMTPRSMGCRKTARRC